MRRQFTPATLRARSSALVPSRAENCCVSVQHNPSRKHHTHTLEDTLGDERAASVRLSSVRVPSVDCLNYVDLT